VGFKLGIITVKISDDVEKKLRVFAYKVFGARRGSLSRAIEEAVKLWISHLEDKVREVDMSKFEVKINNVEKIGEFIESAKDESDLKVKRLIEILGLRE